MSRAADRIGEGDQHMRTNKIPVYSIELERISEALVLSGYTSLDERRSTRLRSIHCLTITKNKHSLVGFLPRQSIEFLQIHRPPAVRAVVVQYSPKGLMLFLENEKGS
jgi:hypothetical protein